MTNLTLSRAVLAALALLVGTGSGPVVTVASAQAAAEGTSLGSVQITKNVMANGQKLAAGTYQVRLTTQEATPAAGATTSLERWVEFVKGGKVVGREVVSIVPQSEIKAVAEKNPPAKGAAKVELLKGNEYLRVWIYRGDNHYLIHMPVAS